MKTILLFLSLFLSFHAFSDDLCSYNETGDLELSTFKHSKNPKRFTFAEKNLIHRTIALESFYAGVSRSEALKLFNDGSSDGKVGYYEFEGKQLILVHYWPGDNEYGAFYEVEAGRTRLIAIVEDSFISCIKE